MEDKEKTRDELMSELKKLKKEYEKLKEACESSSSRSGQMAKIMQDLIEKNPMSIQIVNKEGYTLQVNPAHTRLFGAVPPDDYSVFNDSQLKQQVDKDLIRRVKKGEVVVFPDLYYNVHDLNPDFPDVPVYVRMIIFPITDTDGNPEKFVLMHENITDRRQSERALLESEENYRTLLDLAPDAFFQGNSKGYIIMANKRAAILTGYPKKELLAMNMKDLFSESILNKKPLRYDLLDKGETVTIEREITRRDGSVVIVEMTSRKMPNNTYQAFMKDVSDRKMSEAALKDSEHLYRAIFENTGTASIIIDEDTTIALTNTEWVDLAGYPREEMEGRMSWTRFVVPEDLQMMREYHATRRISPASAPNRYEFRFLRRNGEIRHIMLFVAMIPESRKSIASLLDITDLKKAEETLRDSEERYRAFVEQISDGVFRMELEEPVDITLPVEAVVDHIYDHAVVVECNKAMMKMYNTDDPADIIGKRQIDFHGGRDNPINREALRSFVRDGFRVHMQETEEPDFKGNRRCFINSSLGIIKNGKLVRIWGTQSDITEKKKFENELIKAKEKAEESDRLKSAFLANMSHEIRTPMNGILGFADLLKAPKLTGEQQKEYIDIIEKSGARMLNIINDIIDISKIESGAMKITISDVNINEQIEYLFDFFKPEVGLKNLSMIIRSVLPPDEAIIRTDREKVLAILSNLIKNAVKFTDKGYVEVGCERKNEFLQFYIKDTGVGIPADRHNVVFERFIQADITDRRAFQGAGLGLSISRAFVEMLGGKIWFESQENKGSVFYFTIPYVAEKAGRPVREKGDALKEDRGDRKLRALIVEDDPTSDMYLTLLLGKMNLSVIHARTGQEAVDACLKNKDIDLVLMDIKMPDMNGYEATKKIREFNKKVIIIAQTAHALTGDREKALTAGCNEHITKPIDQAVLSGMVKKLFR